MLGGICGWLGPSTRGGDANEMGAALAGGPRATLSTLGGGNCGGAALGGDIAHGDNGTLALIAGAPRWKSGALEAIARQSGHGTALLDAWQTNGPDMLAQLEGPFVLAVLAPGAGTALLATDRMGRMPLFHTDSGDCLVFGSTLDAVISHPGVDARLSTQSVYHYVYHHAIPSPDSIYEEIGRLRPAHALDWGDGKSTVRQWWAPTFAPDRRATPEELAEELRAALAQSVGDAAADAHTAAFLSGGLDSSTVAGMLSKAQQDPAVAYAIGFDAPGYDEIEYARAARDHFGLDLREYYVTPDDVAATVPKIAAAYDQPFGNSSAIPAYHCARRAVENGIELMLAGDGGDELFGGNPPYGKQQIFEAYGRIPGGLRRGVVEPLALGPLGALPGARKVRRYVEQARIPLPDRLQSYNFLHRHDPAELFNADFLAEVDPALPMARQRAVYSAPGQGDPLHRMMYLDWQYVLADNDLCKVSRTAALAGADVHFPMLNDRVVDLSCRIPPELQVRRAQLRCFYKDAMRGFLPDTIIQKKKHGFGLPFGVWMRDTPVLQEMAGDALGSLRRHGWFRGAFLDRLMDLQRDQHAAYYGELVWVLMMLGLWLDRDHAQSGVAVRHAASS
ncbi:asparagine synthetase B family protein [Aquisalimonas sp. APHAB1-3]|uniref:asparagine synthetase B family protein n=1 Tax=Aquisalimonas sp. APHAB1-3 TaxID=3402080 RepID=UPI003AAAC44F